MIFLFCLFCSSFLFCQTAPSNHIDGVIAVVGDNIVLKSDVLEQSFMLAKQKNINPQTNQRAFEKIFNSVLEEKINRLVVLSAASEDSLISVSYEEINATLEDRIEGFISIFGSREALEDTMGLKINEIKAEYWKTVEEELLVERFRYFRFSDISINRQEVVSFFQNNPDSFPPLPALAEFSVLQKPVVVSKKTKDSLFLLLQTIKDSLLLGSLSFEDGAKKYSQDPGSKDKKGSLGFTKRGTLLPAYEKAAFLLEINEISDPVESFFGLHLIKLNDRVGEKIKTQHILLSLAAGKGDVKKILLSFEEYLSGFYHDPGGFDSLCVSFYQTEKNLSGYYKNFNLLELPVGLKTKLTNLQNYSFSTVFVENNSVFLLYKHRQEDPKALSLIDNWAEIEMVALNQKRFSLFSDWVVETKKNIYVKTFNY